MKILDLALKDLAQIARDKMAFLFLLVMPVAFTFFMGLAFQGVAQPEDLRTPLGWADADPQGALSQALRAALTDSPAVRLVEVVPAEAEATLKAGDVDGVLLIPAGFSQQTLAGEPVQLTLLAADLGTAGQALFQVLRAPLAQTLSAAAIARLSAASLDDASEPSAAFAAAAQAWAAADAETPWVQMEQVSAAEDAAAPLNGNPFNQSSPGMLVQFTIFGLIPAAQILVLERKTRTLQRLITTAMPPAHIIAGHLLAMVALILLQVTLLVTFGQLALGVDYFRVPLATLAIAVTLSLWVASMGLCVGVIAKSEEQVILFSLIAMFVFTALGGAWFPLEVTGPVFYSIGHFTPGAWAMDGLQNILIRGLGLEAVWKPAGILLAYALGFFALAVWRFMAMEKA